MSDTGVTTLDDHGIQGKRLPSLTALRFFAAALVVGVHSGLVFPGIALVLQRGQVGVAFFYLLSGFILTWAPATNDTNRWFYRRRLARILPTHLLTWLVAIALVAPVEGAGQSAIGDVLSLFLLHAWIPTGTIAFAANAPSWSLSVEVLFYVAFPFILPRLRKLRSRGLWALMAAMVLIEAVIAALAPREGLIYIFPLSRLPEFMIGVALCVVVQRGWRVGLPLWGASVIAVATVAVTFMPWVPYRWSFGVITVIPLALLIASAAAADQARTTTLSRVPLVRVGEWSFALFMTHDLLIRIYVVLLPEGLRAPLYPFLLIVCVLVSWATFRWIERPAERRFRGGPVIASAERAKPVGG